MVEDHLMYSTLGEVYEFDCARHGRDSYEQMSDFKEKLNPSIVDRRFEPVYDVNGEIQCNGVVPFRLTCNLECFLTPFGVEGYFVLAMCATAQIHCCT